MAGKTGKAAETAVRGRPRIFAEGSVNVRIGETVYDRVLRLASSERRTVRQQMELLLETALERVELETREGGAA
jgi:hypothetical protein